MTTLDIITIVLLAITAAALFLGARWLKSDNKTFL